MTSKLNYSNPIHILIKIAEDNRYDNNVREKASKAIRLYNLVVSLNQYKMECFDMENTQLLYLESVIKQIEVQCKSAQTEMISNIEEQNRNFEFKKKIADKIAEELILNEKNSKKQERKKKKKSRR